MEVKQHSYTAIFDVFTPKTFILLVSTSDQLGECSFHFGKRIDLIIDDVHAECR